MSDSEVDDYAMSQDDSDGYEPEVVTPAKGKATVAKKAAEPKKTSAAKSNVTKATASTSKKRKVTSDSENSDGGNKDDEVAPPPKSKKKTSDYNENKTIEEIYQKKTPLEHILLRPDTYIGTTEMNKETLWVLDAGATRFVKRDVRIVPGLYKIVDEIIVNAADNKIRDPTMDTIKVDIDKENGRISVYNNGKGIPVEIHKAEGVYVPELIFGHLLTSSNYDDTQKKVTGGRNGYGAKLCNIFSTEFIVETADKSKGLYYKQVFSKNMSVTGKPKITQMKKPDEFTKISFKPDMARFNMQGIDDDLEALLKKRTYDMAGCVKGVKVYLNGERIKIKSFKEYIDMYLTEGDDKPKVIYDSPNDRWEIACVPSDGQFQQVSFVNSISTSKGGTHTDHVAAQIVKELVDTVQKKSKSKNIKPFHIKNHMWIFVKCLIENPAFDSQTKETLTLKASAFGSKCEISDKFLKEMSKSPVVDGVIDLAAAKDAVAMKKTDGTTRSRLNIVKLEDAQKAGFRRGRDCTLILTEGDSAKSLVMAGFSVIGREKFGVFPLRGKLLNVRDTPLSVVAKNEEIKNIKEILGLKQNHKYTSVDELRYGHLMIMTDQDHDGSHIKGLVINFFEHYFPSLLKIPGFLVEFITPIVKATKGRETRAFFTIPEYESWKESEDGARGWKIKYYKGLGTSTKEDAKDYFSDMDKHKKEFLPLTEEAQQLVDMAFNKSKADDRKTWLSNFQPGTFLDTNINRIPIEDFINKELILFSMADNIRSIPSMVDGLKPGQRKVMFGAFKKKIQGEIKVAQLAGYVSEKSAYHHGEVSLTMTIVGLAQDFVGNNNINLLSPIGQFGTRMLGGKDAASARYIFTAVEPITRRIFHPQDDALLTYLNDDGDWIEPNWYIPILPMVLVNGSEGIGTGWSSNIPNYNPSDIIANIRRLMKGEEQVPMTPWFRGFVGTIEKESVNRFKVLGKIEEIDDNKVRITELPLRTWTTPYKEQLEQWISGTEKTPSWIKDYDDESTLTSVNLTVTLKDGKMAKAREEGLEKSFKLVGSLATSNMVCFDPQGRIKRYTSPEEIVQEFFDIRIDYYRKRKAHLINMYTRQWVRLNNKMRFILMIISGELLVQNRKKLSIVEEMRAKNFASVTELDIEVDAGASAETVDPNAVKIKVERDSEFDYLLKMPIWSLTHEKVEELKKERDAKNAELKLLIDKTPNDLWNEDLDAFMVSWEELLQKDIDDANYMGAGHKGKAVKGKGKARATAKMVVKKQTNVDDDDDFTVSKPKKPATTRKKPSVEVKDEVKDEPMDEASVISAPKAATSVSKANVSGAPKKQQSIIDMMKNAAKSKPSQVAESPVKSESMSDDDDAPSKSKAKASSKARTKKVISDDEDLNSDGDQDFAQPDDVDDEEIVPRSRAPRAARSKRSVIVDDFSDVEDDEDDFLPSPKKKPVAVANGSSKLIKSEDVEAENVVKGKEEKERITKKVSPPARSKADESEDEVYVPKATASRGKGKATYKSRARTIASDSEDLEGREEDRDEGKEDEDSDSDEYQAPSKASKSKVTAKKATTKNQSSTPAPAKPLSVIARTKKMFSLMNDEDGDGEDEDRSGEEKTEKKKSTKDSENDVEMASGEDEKVTKSNGKKVAALKVVDSDDDSMFAISAPSKVGQVKKRVPNTTTTSSTSGGMSAGRLGKFGGSHSELGKSASVGTTVPSAGSMLLADLEDVSLMMNRPGRAKATDKKPKYVDISD
ncbi:DNA topoisomerase 2 [Podila epigama]|nr:DNA topoisomerase 2 [Podila epigama]